MQTIVLASASPRRLELLVKAGVSPAWIEVVGSGFDENSVSETAPDKLVSLLSEKKAFAVLERIQHQRAIIIAADTAVSLDGHVMGKPRDSKDAINMLKALRGNAHTVYTGVTLLKKNGACWEKKQITDSARVFIRTLTDDEILKYVKTGEPLDKAGAYAIQERGCLLVEKIEGDFYTVVGLPLVKVCLALREFGFNLL